MSNTRNTTWRPTKNYVAAVPPAPPVIDKGPAFLVTTVAGPVTIRGMVHATTKAKAAVEAIRKHREAGQLANNITVLTRDIVEA